MAIDLGLTETQRLLRENLRQFLQNECPISVVRAARDLPSEVAESLLAQVQAMGIYGLAVPEQYGGEGAGFVELAIACREFGRALAPVPFRSVAAIAAPVMARFGSDPLKAARLPAITDGSIVVPALAEADGRYLPGSLATELRVEGGRMLLDGAKLFVSDGQIADAFLVSAVAQRSIGGARHLLACVDASAGGVTMRRLRSAAADGQAELRLDEVEVAADQLLPAEAETFAHTAGQVATAHDAFGAAQAAFEMATTYAKERVQFGRAIGSFQGIQFKLADAAIALDSADLISHRASSLLDARSTQAPMMAVMAKQLTSDAALLALRHAHQIFAGVGFIREHDLHLFHLRIQTDELIYGSPHLHARAVGRTLLENEPFATRWLLREPAL